MRQFRHYTLTEILLDIGLSSILFVIGGIFVGYIYEIARNIYHLANWVPPKFIVTEWLAQTFHLHYWREAFPLTGIIGIILMLVGLLGYVSIFRWAIFKLLKRKH